MYFSSMVILQSYWKWKAVPIITSVDDSLTMISEIPFPAVTVCPDIKYNITEFNWFKKLQELEQNPEKISDEE